MFPAVTLLHFPDNGARNAKVSRNINLAHAGFRHASNFYDCGVIQFGQRPICTPDLSAVFGSVGSVSGCRVPSDMVWIYAHRFTARMRRLRFIVRRFAVRQNAHHPRRQHCGPSKTHDAVSLHGSERPLNASAAFRLNVLLQEWQRRLFGSLRCYRFHDVETVSFPSLKVRKTHFIMPNRNDGAAANRDRTLCHSAKLSHSTQKATGV